ncbi:10294_t:CDS:2, partial [Funneliformis mosseae]
LGQSYILKTIIESDEEQIMEAYDKGLECLKQAYKLDPDNENLREQLETLGALIKDDNVEYFG